MYKQPNRKKLESIKSPNRSVRPRRQGIPAKDLYLEVLEDAAETFFLQSLPEQRGHCVVEIACFLAAYSLSDHCADAERYINIGRLNDLDVNHDGGKTQPHLSRDHLPVDTVIFNATSSAQDKGALPGRCLTALSRALDTYLPTIKTWLADSATIILCFSEKVKLDSLHAKFIKNKLHLFEKTQWQDDEMTHYIYELRPISFSNPVQAFIYDDDYLWFEKYQPFLKTGSVLKVGNGLGFASYFMSLSNEDVTSLDVVLNDDALNDEIILYEGSRIPFDDESFDTVVCTYTLHHTPNPEALFKELCRVSRSNVVVIEETYNNIWQKLDLIFTCWRTNLRGGQKVQIQWQSYLSAKRFANLFNDQGFRISKREQAPRNSFMVDLIVGTK